MQDPLIYGSGLIARGFATVRFRKPVVVFASGVSNSRETSPEQFRRETRLVEEGLSAAGREARLFIYFSTCSVRNATPYTRHKQEMERIVSAAPVRHLICRLPQVVGLVQNATLFSYLATQLWKGNPVTVQEHAVRNVIDINDVTRVVRDAVDSGLTNTTIEIGAKHSIPVREIVSLLANEYQSRSEVTVVPGGDRVTVDLAPLAAILPATDPLRSSRYPVNLCRTWAALFAQFFQAQARTGEPRSPGYHGTSGALPGATRG